MRVQFNPEKFDVWLDYYTNQASQVGYGISGFRGMPYQRGAGLGSFFRSLYRMAVPLIKSAAGRVGQQALTTGADIAADLVRGRPVMETIEEHGREGVSKLIDDASRNIKQRGRGLGRRPKAIKGDVNDIFTNKKKGKIKK